MSTPQELAARRAVDECLPFPSLGKGGGKGFTAWIRTPSALPRFVSSFACSYVLACSSVDGRRVRACAVCVVSKWICARPFRRSSTCRCGCRSRDRRFASPDVGRLLCILVMLRRRIFLDFIPTSPIPPRPRLPTPSLPVSVFARRRGGVTTELQEPCGRLVPVALLLII